VNFELLAGGVLLAILVWAGRQSRRGGNATRLARALFAALAAAGAVVAGLRGQVVVTLVLLALAAWLGQSARKAPASPDTGSMTDAEARSILGVGPEAGRSEIQAAWRRLMPRAHPDQGGSAGLAAQLNAARDRLLK